METDMITTNLITKASEKNLIDSYILDRSDPSKNMKSNHLPSSMNKFFIVLIVLVELLCGTYAQIDSRILNSDERRILETFYEGTNGDEWNNNDGWNDSESSPCDGWHGVSCNNDGSVIRVELERNNLVGNFPKEVFSLHYLEELNLRRNPEMKFQFDGIGNAKNLYNLQLSHAKIISLDGIGQASDSNSLEILHLTSCMIPGPLPDELFDVKSLTALFMNYNEFSGTLPSLIGNLVNLKQLFAYGNIMTGTIPSEIGSCKKLEELTLAENLWTGTIPAEVNDLTKLEILALQQDELYEKFGRHDGLTGTLPDFSDLQYLTELYLGSNSLSGSISHNFLANSMVTTDFVAIELSNNYITGTLPNRLSHFDQLSILVDGNYITGISQPLCNKGAWMDGDVQIYGCDSILCPLNTYNPDWGRQYSNSTRCINCKDSLGTKFMGSYSCYPDDLDVLNEFFKSTGGKNWNTATNWLTDSNFCSWYGISCDKSGVIESIRMKSNNLRGKIPNNLFSLPLKFLDLKSNEVSIGFGDIDPDNKLTTLILSETNIDSLEGISNLLHLTDLRLTDVAIDSLDNELYTLTKLKLLHMADNNVNGSISKYLSRLSELTDLSFHNNYLSGNIPPEIGDLTKLEVLQLQGNKLTGRVPSELFNLPIYHLDLKQNPIDFTFENIGNMKKLSILRLSETGLSSVEGIGNAKSLKELHLTDNQLRGSIPDEIFSLEGLEELLLNYNKLSGTIPESIGDLKQLVELYLYDNNLFGQIPTGIGKLSRLTVLALAGNELTGTLPKDLNLLTDLSILSLENEDPDNKGIEGPLLDFAGFSEITYLLLGGNRLTGTIPSTFLEESNKKSSIMRVELANNLLTGSIPKHFEEFDRLDILLVGNMITHIPEKLCGKVNWMGGRVEDFGCDAILCPPATYNSIGRQDSGMECITCEAPNISPFLGSLECVVDADNQNLHPHQIMELLYTSTDGPNWRRQDNWLSDSVPMCEWYGIVCKDVEDENGEVIATSHEIDLEGNRLSGTVPNALFRLSRLSSIKLSHNSIKFDLHGISEATSLEVLKLSNIGLTSLSGLASESITRLHLASNDLSGSFPEEILNLPHLEKVSLYDNNLSGQIPAALRSLSYLMHIDLSQNNFDGTLPEELMQLTKLQTLYAFNSKPTEGIKGKLLDFSNMPDLTELLLDGNSLSGSIPSTLLEGTSHSEDKVIVSLGSNRLSGTIPVEVGERFQQLELVIMGNMIDNIPDELCSMDTVAGWMNGDVGAYGCEALLCRPGTFNPIGRQSTSAETDTCKACDDPTAAPFWGSMNCNALTPSSKLSESDVLEKFYSEIGGPYWVNNENWLDLSDGMTFCNWYGIECEKDNEGIAHVVSIALVNNGLAGAFPKEIFLLPRLRSLDLKENEINFSFNGIGNAANLEYIRLSDNKISSLEGLGKATRLTSLHMTYAGLSGTIPEEIFALTNLQELYFDYNNLKGTISENIGQLTKLKELYLFDNNLTGQIPSTVGLLTNLDSLVLSENDLSGSLPEELGDLENLSVFALQQTKKRGPGISGPLLDFHKLSKITNFLIGSNKLTGSIPANFLATASISNEKVIEIDLSLNQLSGTVPEELASFSLLSIFLIGNKISGISEDLCTKNSWMKGLVEKFGCDAILCPSDTFNIYGRAEEDLPCIDCGSPSVATYYGSISCLSTEDQESNIERAILTQFFNDLDGENWKISDNWLDPSKSICDWHGITCSSSAHPAVESINLSRNLLNGQVTSNLFMLTDLQHLNLAQNDIEFSFENIGDALNLKSLDLDNTGTISISGIGSATNLNILRLMSNDFYGDIPDEIFSLTNLELLYLSANAFTGEVPSGLTNLEKLTEFSCFQCGLTGTVPTWIGDMSYLKYIALNGNRLSGTIPPQISNLQNLQHLDISDAMLSGTVPELMNLNKLSELLLKGNSLTGTIPKNFLRDASSNALTVDLRSNFVKNFPGELFEFSKLTILLADNLISEFSTEEACEAVPHWMGGDVETYGCSAILCPPGTFHENGRRDSGTECQHCRTENQAPYYGSTECILTTVEILEKIYDMADGNNWKVRSNWNNEDGDVCSWHGIGCKSVTGSRKDIITSIKLANNNLVGTIPHEIFRSLPSLTYLDISGNPVDLSFEHAYRGTNLTHFHANATNLASLDGIAVARNLRELRLQRNDFGGKDILSELFTLTKLESLDISASKVDGKLTEKMANLKKLVSFHASDNSLRGKIPPIIGSLTSLESLVLSENEFTGSLPNELNMLTNLRSLYIDGYTKDSKGIVGELLDFALLSDLTVLSLASNSLTGTIPRNLLGSSSQGKNSVIINFHSNRLSGSLPNELNRFEKLQIDVADNKISGIDEELCAMDGWMNGIVADFGCDAILCPAGTANVNGRQSNSALDCGICEGATLAPFFGSVECVPDETKMEARAILERFYFNCGGQKWSKQKNWLDPKIDVCEWEGIACENNEVTSILMGSNNVVGTPPSEIFDLPSLEFLWLYSNPIDFSFDNIGSAISLKSLLLDSTGLSSIEGIKEAKSLTELDVRFNELGGTFPFEITNLANLESLSCSTNNFVGTLPSELGLLTNLKKLRLGSNHFRGTIPDFASFPSLIALDISGNQFSGSIPSELMRDAGKNENNNVFFIDLSSNYLTGTAPSGLSRFDDLTIYLRDNMLEGISHELCNNDWNHGDIAEFGCDGLLCKPRTYNEIGRQSRDGSACQKCDTAEYYGEVTCFGIHSSKNSAGSGLTVHKLFMAILTLVWTSTVFSTR